MEGESNNNLISLREAAEYTRYSQEYLNLRIRQGKLKGVKIGRNWATTREWMDEYVERINNYKNQRIERKKKKAIPPPSPFTPTPTSFRPGPRAWSMAITLALIFVLGSVGTIFSYPYLEPAIKSIRISDLTTNISAGTNLITKELSQLVTEEITEVGQSIFQTIFRGAKSIKNFTFNLTNDLVRFISQDISAIKKFTKEIPRTVLETFKKIVISSYENFNSF